MKYIVTAPYIVPKVRDQLGAWIHRGFYKDAVINTEDIDPASLQHHLDSDLMAPVDAPEAPAPAPEPKIVEPPQPVNPVGPERPKDYASKPEWVEYAVLLRHAGVSEGDARTAAEDKSKADLIAEYGS